MLYCVSDINLKSRAVFLHLFTWRKVVSSIRSRIVDKGSRGLNLLKEKNNFSRQASILTMEAAKLFEVLGRIKIQKGVNDG